MVFMAVGTDEFVVPVWWSGDQLHRGISALALVWKGGSQLFAFQAFDQL